ncbi:MAG TPA: hypothetical protein VFW38_00370 [Solirubrobacteraceae bacterium]|nr:hypothetical protein [Solirubrobacteraceae bacterium]
MVRSPLAIVNELSAIAEPVGDTAMASIIGDFAASLRAILTIRSDVALVTSVGLNRFLATDAGETVSAFAMRTGGRTRDEWRYILQMRNHAPFSTAPGLKMLDAAEEFSFQGEVAEGLGLAASNQQLAISLPGGAWTESELTVDRTWLEENEAGELLAQHAAQLVAHVATPTHAEVHCETIKTLSLQGPFDGRDLWSDRANLYPHIDFLARVADQMTTLSSGGDRLRQVAIRLAQLEESTSKWVPSDFPAPEWQSEVTPEHETRKRLCRFTDSDGTTRVFDLHARFKPGHGRIHFRLAPKNGKPHLVVAHIGEKLL